MSAVPELLYERPPLYPAQEAAIFTEHRYAVVEASTKSGKTHACIAWLFEQAALTGAPGRRYWWVAPTAEQALIAFRRLVRALPPGLASATDSSATIQLPNGAAIVFRSGDHPDALYGEDVHAAVLDEASRMREETWHAVRSTITATRGRVRIIGNVRGRRNWAYQLARRAEAGEPGWRYARLTWRDAVAGGVVPLEEIEQARRDLPETTFRELYEADAQDDGINPFGLESIAACLSPLSDDLPVAWGWDLARVRDWTVGIALDASGRVCRFERFQRPWGATEERILAQTGTTPATVDATGVGDPVVERLQRRGRYTGFTFTALSRQQLLDGLRLAIQQREIAFPDGPIRLELEAMEVDYTATGVRYGAPRGQHDDCVMALALAVHAWGDRPGPGIW